MRVPIRKPGKQQKINDHHITLKKFQELQSELKRVKAAHPHLASEVKRLALLGDFSENAAYQIAKGRLRGLNSRIEEIEYLLKNAEIIEVSRNKSEVQLGHLVTLRSPDGDKTYQLLGSSETNPDTGIISHNSPLGSAIIGKKIGDKIEIKLKSGKTKTYEIIKIES